MPRPVAGFLLEHVQVMGAPLSAANKVVPAGDAIFPAILVAGIFQQRHKRTANLK